MRNVFPWLFHVPSRNSPVGSLNRISYHQVKGLAANNWSTDLIAQLTQYPFSLKISQIFYPRCVFNWRRTFNFRHQILQFSAILQKLFELISFHAQSWAKLLSRNTQWYLIWFMNFSKIFSKVHRNSNQNILNLKSSLFEAESTMQSRRYCAQ